MRFLLLASLLLAPTLANADAPSRTADATKMATDDCARARKQNKTCVLKMESTDINGGVPTASGTGVGILTFAQHASLVRIRKDFIVEILKSAEDLD